VRAALVLALGLVGTVGAAACHETIDAGGDGADAAIDDDPLAVSDPAPPGSLDDLHRTLIAPRCSGQPGLCHNGQFEPNLSTPGLAYAYLVNRPGLEQPDRLRVAPGAAGESLLVHKLRGEGVATRMPLGADPLTEPEIAAIEAWIDDGALRRPDAEPAPVLNNPPRLPEIGVFDAGGARLDAAGPALVTAGATITLRHSVEDFETDDDAIPFGAFILQAADGRQVVLSPGSDDPGLAPTAYDGDGPMGNGDLLDWQVEVTLGATLTLYREATGATEDVDATTLTLTPLAVYLDEFPGGIAAFEVSARPITIEAP
jgi:hypothetical protein